MIVDTHTHAILEENNNDRADFEILIGHTLKEAKNAIKQAKIHKHVFATCGLYPHDIKPEDEIPDEKKLLEIEILAKNEKVVGIGECGLDFTKPKLPEIKRTKKKQIKLFTSQINLAKKLNLPIIIHSRLATEELFIVLKQESPFQSVWHCFTENYITAKKALDLGLMLSITGIITYANANDLRDAVKKIPLENIMLETDSPYLVPQKAKDKGVKVNSSKYVRLIAQEIAGIKGISQKKVEDITSKNAFDFFKLS